ncbi:hypothetical protein GCM10027570_52100 [Streptomonospora sediminis]
MRLTEFTDVSLLLVMRLAVAGEDKQLTTRAAADMLAVSYAHTAKAVARLSELGLIGARRGRGGGLRLTDAGRQTRWERSCGSWRVQATWWAARTTRRARCGLRASCAGLPPLRRGPVLAARAGQCRTAAAAAPAYLRRMGLDRGWPTPARQSVPHPRARISMDDTKRKINGAVARAVPISDGYRHEAIEPQVASIGR